MKIPPLFGDRPWQGLGLWLASLLLLILPLSHTAALRSFLAIALIVLSATAISRRRWPMRFPARTPWLIYLGVALLSLIWAVDRSESVSDVKSELLYGMICFLIGANWFGRREALPILRWTMHGVALVVLADLSLFLWHLYAMTDSRPVFTGGRLIGMGKLSSYLVMTFPFLLMGLSCSRFERYLSVLLLAGSMAALYVSGNRMAFVVLVVQLVVGCGLLAWSSRRLVLILSGFAVAVALVAGLAFMQFQLRTAAILGTQQASVSQEAIQQTLADDPRWMIWSHTLENPRTPWWHGSGFGLGSFKRVYPELSSQPGTELYTHAHNVFLNKYVQLGLPGAIAFALLIAMSMRGLLRTAPPDLVPWRIVLTMALVGMLLKVQTDDFFNRDVGWMFWLLAGCTAALFGNGSRAYPTPTTVVRA